MSTRDLTVDWGATGLTGTLAYRVLSSAGATLIARTATGVAEFPAGSGIYHVQVTTWDDSWVGRVVWDAGGSGVGSFAAVAFDAQSWATPADVGGITITPFVATAANPQVARRDLSPIDQGSAPVFQWTIVGGTGAAVSLAGKILRFVVASVDEGDSDDDALTGAWKYETGGSGIVVSGGGSNVVTVTTNAADHDTPAPYRYWLWNVTNKRVLAKGKYPVTPAVIDT